MKKFISVVAILVFCTQSVFPKDVITSDKKKLPARATEFIEQHFNEMEISYIKIDKEFLWGKTYEVILTDGTEIEFDDKGYCVDVDAKNNKVPLSVIPENVNAYLKKLFSNQFVVQIKYKKREIEVELNNDLELIFDKKGNFIRLED